MEYDGSYGGGRRSLRYEFSREPNGSTVSTTLGGILSIKETTSSYRIQNRTLLDLIRNDPTSENNNNNNNNNNNDSKKPWKKMFREKLRLKLAGSVCTTTVPVLASLIHINTDNNRTDRLNSPLPLSNSNGNTSNVPVTQTANRTSPLISPLISNNNASIVPVSLTETHTNILNTPLVSNNNTSSVTVTLTENSTNMLNTPPVSNRNSYTSSVPVTQQVNGTDLLNSPSVSHSNSNTNSVRYTQTENVRSEQVEENSDGGEATEKVSLMRLLEVEGSACFEEMVVEDGGDGGGSGGEGYNNCCVCMVRHKGAAFIPCGHTFCRLCSRELFVKRANCPLCNNFIVEILDIF